MAVNLEQELKEAKTIISKLSIENSRLRKLCLSMVEENCSGTQQYQEKVNEVLGKSKPTRTKISIPRLGIYEL